MYYALIPLHVLAVLSFVLGVMRNSFLCTFPPISKITAIIFSLSFLALQGAVIGGRLAYLYHSMYILCIGTLLHSSCQAYRYTLGYKNLYFHQKPIGRPAKLTFGNTTLEGNLVSIEPGKYWVFENLEKYVDGKLVFEVDEIYIE
ncbi:hypothetical protein CAEBREN_09850 [Caenorhabditis brenneri]|uniref:Uncharacterized protein n=1 Tax=Caenorhabditis brenneri TaxID=135651 RepID=G0MGI3_CAEBE|nr:hypothetical protein CAEBREN_09850 [Caenorhabditis brenneri]